MRVRIPKSLKPYHERVSEGLGLYSLTCETEKAEPSGGETCFVTVELRDPKTAVLFFEMQRTYGLSNAALVVASLDAVKRQEERQASIMQKTKSLAALDRPAEDAVSEG